MQRQPLLHQSVNWFQNYCNSWNAHIDADAGCRALLCPHKVRVTKEQRADQGGCDKGKQRAARIWNQPAAQRAFGGARFALCTQRDEKIETD